MSHLENQLPQDLSLGARFQMAKEMYDRRVVKSQAAAAAMIPMNCSTFTIHFCGLTVHIRQEYSRFVGMASNKIAQLSATLTNLNTSKSNERGKTSYYELLLYDSIQIYF
jgi:hypothetical protein